MRISAPRHWRGAEPGMPIGCPGFTPTQSLKSSTAHHPGRGRVFSQAECRGTVTYSRLLVSSGVFAVEHRPPVWSNPKSRGQNLAKPKRTVWAANILYGSKSNIGYEAGGKMRMPANYLSKLLLLPTYSAAVVCVKTGEVSAPSWGQTSLIRHQPVSASK